MQKTLPERTIQFSKLRKAMHGLTNLTEEFLVAMRMRNKGFQKKKLLVAELGERNIYGQFEKGTKGLIGELEMRAVRDEVYFEEQFKLRKQMLEHPLTGFQKKSVGLLKDLSLDLDNHYFIQKLNLACALSASKDIYSTNIELGFINEIVAEIINRQLHDLPTTNLYLSIYQLFAKADKDEALNVMIDGFLLKKNLLSAFDREIILNYLINFTLKQINIGKSDFVRKNFELYKIGINDGIMVTNNRMPVKTFGNIVSGGSFLKEFDWTKKIIEEYKIYIEENIREEVVLFNLSNLYFKQGDFNKTIEILYNKNFTDVLYKILTKTLLLKSYYEIYIYDDSYYELMIAQIESFEKFIRREKQIAKTTQISFLNFVKYLKKLMDIEINKSENNKLIKSINKENLLSSKPWLLEKAG